MIILYLFIALFIILLGGVSYYFARLVLYYNRVGLEESIHECMEKGEFDRSFLEIPKDNFIVHSSDGTALSGFAIPGSEKKTVIMAHGISWTRYGVVKYMHEFLAQGWNIITFDHRRHGESEGKYPTFGFKEKQDIKAVADWAFHAFPDTELFGVLGESMGAASVLQYAPMDTRLQFVISDCAYSDLHEELMHQQSLLRVPRPLQRFFLFFAGIIIRLRAGFSLSEVSPKKDIMKTDVPILFVHGTEDNYVPTRMGEEMYELRKEHAPSDILLVEGATHAMSYNTAPELYRKKLREFLQIVENRAVRMNKEK